MPTDSCCPKCDALRMIEWEVYDKVGENECPACCRYQRQGHASDCHLAAALDAPCAVRLMRERAEELNVAFENCFRNRRFSAASWMAEAERVLRDILVAVEGGRPGPTPGASTPDPP